MASTSKNRINVQSYEIKNAIKHFDIKTEENLTTKDAKELYDKIVEHKTMNSLPDNGIAYEDYLTTNEQDFLKEITNSKSHEPFQDSKYNRRFYKNWDINDKPLLDDNGRHLYEVASIDLDDGNIALEIKNNFELDYIEIQGPKLYGNTYRKPYYTQTDTGEWKLYNIWNTQILSKDYYNGKTKSYGDWQYKKDNKELQVLGLLNDGEYLYDMTSVLEDEFPLIEELDRKGKKGETLYKIIPEELHKTLNSSDRQGSGGPWFKILKTNKGMIKVK